MPHPPVDLSAALSKFTPSVRDRLRAVLQRNDFNGVISAADAQHLAEAMGVTVTRLMLDLLPFVAFYAQPLISAFRVGAIAQGVSGNLYYGANMEFMGESLIYTVHAEQAATVNAWMNGDSGIVVLAVSAAPCGYCRQFLYELATARQLQICLPDKPPQSINYYLPDPFGPADLGVTAGLMSSQRNGLVLDQQSNDWLVSMALAAANMSYAPYTSAVAPNQGKACYAGVALQASDGSIFTGAYAENAAYNPAMLPMEAALIMMNLSGRYGGALARAVMVQSHVLGQPGRINPLCDQQAVSAQLLHTVSDTPLEVVFAHQV